ncbi:nuclear transport factor 2 family protein [Halomicrobium urmianum]|uniref:nuclear transport factor 2 family protein n=1 Tax=Halomicrobium urmianum TaxID=1586233 RepID=UPI001CD9DF50|nr:nuclear transport factor 2 family protein [Halomicrobium urmianum]
MSATESVLDHHLAMFGEGDLDGIMEDYAADAVLMTETDTFEGRDEIRAMYEQLLPEFDDDVVTFSLDEQKTVDDVAYIVWHAETPENEYEYATDTFVIRDGEIVAQTLAAKITPK